MIVEFSRMMKDFDGLMHEIIVFTNHNETPNLKEIISKTSEKQKKYLSKHKYNLDKFGLSEKQIKEDCAIVYETFSF